ncbi:MAG: DUF3394 domain-containing protein, partial [Pseudomonadota bacterium]
IAILLFTAGTMGYFLTRSTIFESIALVLISFALFRPDFFMDRVQPPFQFFEPTAISEAVGQATTGSEMRLIVSGPDFDTGEVKETTLVLPIAEDGTGDERLDALGLTVFEEDGQMKLDEPFPGTPFSETMSSFDFYGDDPVVITNVKADSNQLPQELMFLPAFVLLAGIVILQRRRASREEATDAQGVTA